MSIQIEYTFNGKKFTSYDDAVAAAILEGYKKIVEKKLALYSDQINDTGGKILINYNSHDHGADVTLHDMPVDLAEQLSKVLSE